MFLVLHIYLPYKKTFKIRGYKELKKHNKFEWKILLQNNSSYNTFILSNQKVRKLLLDIAVILGKNPKA